MYHFFFFARNSNEELRKKKKKKKHFYILKVDSKKRLGSFPHCFYFQQQQNIKSSCPCSAYTQVLDQFNQLHCPA